MYVCIYIYTYVLIIALKLILNKDGDPKCFESLKSWPRTGSKNGHVPAPWGLGRGDMEMFNGFCTVDMVFSRSMLNVMADETSVVIFHIMVFFNQQDMFFHKVDLFSKGG